MSSSFRLERFYKDCAWMYRFVLTSCREKHEGVLVVDEKTAYDIMLGQAELIEAEGFLEHFVCLLHGLRTKEKDVIGGRGNRRRA